MQDPKGTEPKEIGTLFSRLVEIMAKLRSPEGCPWDRKQTTESLKPYLVEETYEVLESIEKGDPEKFAEELGDLLFQIVFHAQVCREKGQFDMGYVLRKVEEKMIRRHPHVFGDEKASTPQEVLAHWEAIKEQETHPEAQRSVLAGVPAHLPALLRSHRLQTKAARVGFDWPQARDVLEKIEEELNELRASMEGKSQFAKKEEIGDLLFSVVNLARLLEVDPEDALQQTSHKFVSRFRHMEERAREKGKSLQEMSLEEMDTLWEEAKRIY